ncbi:MAG: hypothetical protein ACLVHV_11075 [Oscillospiraceae bacterium]
MREPPLPAARWSLCLLLRPGDEAAPDPALNQTPEPSAPQSGSEAKASRQFPEIQYGSGAGGVAADIALPDGHFQEDLTQEELAALFGETGWWEALGWTLSGYAVYDGEGRLWQVFLSGSGGTDGAYTLALAPDRLPAACVETDSQEINDIWGTEVSAGRVHFDCDGDDAEEFCYTLSFLRDETLGARLEVTDENSATGQALREHPGPIAGPGPTGVPGFSDAGGNPRLAQRRADPAGGPAGGGFRRLSPGGRARGLSMGGGLAGNGPGAVRADPELEPGLGRSVHHRRPDAGAAAILHGRPKRPGDL